MCSVWQETTCASRRQAGCVTTRTNTDMELPGSIASWKQQLHLQLFRSSAVIDRYLSCYAPCDQQHTFDRSYTRSSSTCPVGIHRSDPRCLSIAPESAPIEAATPSILSTTMSMKVPVHRRPSWAKNERSYEAHMRAERPNSPRPPVHSPDFGPDSFSYDPQYLHQWLAPPTIMYKEAPFPQLMKLELDNWSHAGAALCTALERVDKLAGQAMHRGWPASRALLRFSRQGSVGSPAVAGASDHAVSPSRTDSPFALPPSAASRSTSPPPTSIATPPSTADTAVNSKAGMPQANPIFFIDSPVLSPAGANTPAHGVQDGKNVGPDLSNFPADISPHPSSCVSGSGTQTPSAKFDENAWEVYLGNFHAELSDIRAHALSRWKGSTRTIDRLHSEYGRMTEFTESMHTFENWWNLVRTEMGEYEERVKALRVPELEQVKQQRADLGLPL